MMAIVILTQSFCPLSKEAGELRSQCSFICEAGVLLRGGCNFDAKQPRKDKRGCLVTVCAPK